MQFFPSASRFVRFKAKYCPKYSFTVLLNYATLYYQIQKSVLCESDTKPCYQLVNVNVVCLKINEHLALIGNCRQSLLSVIFLAN
jgi:hypothetical protein